MITILIKLFILFIVVYGIIKHIKWVIIIGIILLLISFLFGQGGFLNSNFILSNATHLLYR